MLLASDDANREFSNPSNPDRFLQVEFYQRTTQHNFNISANKEHALCGDMKDCPHTIDPRTKGKTFPLPEFIQEDWVRIAVPGKSDSVIDTPVRDDHIARFPEQWANYQKHMSAADQVMGTKLSDWEELKDNPHLVEFLKSNRFYTVEQIANCSDGQLQSLGMHGNMMRQKARAKVLSGRESDVLAKKDKEIADLKASIAQQVEEAVKQAMAQAQPPAAEPPKRKGRPPKHKATDANASATGQSSSG